MLLRNKISVNWLQQPELRLSGNNTAKCTVYKQDIYGYHGVITATNRWCLGSLRDKRVKAWVRITAAKSQQRCSVSGPTLFGLSVASKSEPLVSWQSKLCGTFLNRPQLCLLLLLTARIKDQLRSESVQLKAAKQGSQRIKWKPKNCSNNPLLSCFQGTSCDLFLCILYFEEVLMTGKLSSKGG